LMHWLHFCYQLKVYGGAVYLFSLEWPIGDKNYEKYSLLWLWHEWYLTHTCWIKFMYCGLSLHILWIKQFLTSLRFVWLHFWSTETFLFSLGEQGERLEVYRPKSAWNL
jgi:hypothetical protein